MAGKGRLRAAQSRYDRRPVGAAAWVKGKPGMKVALPWVAYRREAGRGGRGGRWPQPSVGKMLRSKSACAVRRGAKMQVRREAVSGEPIALLLTWCALALGRCCGRRAWFGLVRVAVSRGRQAYRPNPACSGRGYAPGRPARQKFGKILAVGGGGRHAPPLTQSLGKIKEDE